MSNRLSDAAAYLATRRTECMAGGVIYWRGDESVEVQATVGQTVFETADSYGVLERSESRDFLILAADLILGGAAILPERGDRISETQGVKTYTYEVMAPGKEPCWRWSDPFRQTIRIHTKQVAVEG